MNVLDKLKKKRLDKKTKKRISLITVAIVIIMFIFFMIKDTHAFYNYEIAPVPIFTGKVGNFAKQDIEEYLASQENSGFETKENMEAREDTLRRYQGSSVNNYICFGTTNVSDCTKDTDKYMYRIIGIDTVTKELKIQKKEALNTKYSWYTSSIVSYEQSNLYTNVLKNIFYNDKNYVPKDWESIISDHNWKYGEVDNFSLTGAEMLKSENNFAASVTSKVGLVSLSDFYLTKSNNANCSTSSGGCETNWLWIKNGNDSNPPHQWAEWTMNKYRGSNPFHITSNGYVSHNDTGTLALSIRPVMFIRNITKLSGTGTLGEPFMIISSKPVINDIKVTSDLGTSITVEVDAIDDKKVTQYCYKLNTESNYMCTSSNTYTFTVNKDIYYYLVEVYVKDNENNSSDVLKKEIRRIKKRTRQCKTCSTGQHTSCPGATCTRCAYGYGAGGSYDYFDLTPDGAYCVMSDSPWSYSACNSVMSAYPWANTCIKRGDYYYLAGTNSCTSWSYASCTTCLLGCDSWSEWSDWDYVESCEAGTVTTEASSVETECSTE